MLRNRARSLFAPGASTIIDAEDVLKECYRVIIFMLTCVTLVQWIDAPLTKMALTTTGFL